MYHPYTCETSYLACYGRCGATCLGLIVFSPVCKVLVCCDATTYQQEDTGERSTFKGSAVLMPAFDCVNKLTYFDLNLLYPRQT